MALAGAVVNIPCFYALESESIFLKIIWRHLILVIMLIPKVFFDLTAIGDRIHDIFNPGSIFSIFFLSFINILWVYLFYLAASHTFSAHTMLLQLPMLFAVLWKVIRRQMVTILELIGIGCTVFGAY